MKRSAFSRRSSPRNRGAPAWDCPLVGGSSRRMAAVWGRAPTLDGVRPFNSRCPSRRQRPHPWPSNALATDNCCTELLHDGPPPKQLGCLNEAKVAYYLIQHRQQERNRIALRVPLSSLTLTVATRVLWNRWDMLARFR